MPTDRQTPPSYLSPAASIYDVIGSDELGPCQDWRDLIVRVADFCMRRVYRSEADPAEWGRPVNRQVLEGLLDATSLPADLTVGDLQHLTQAAINEAEDMHAILGAALVMAWPASPVGLVDWPDRAIALSGLRNDRAGVHADPVGLEMRRTRRRAVSSSR